MKKHMQSRTDVPTETLLADVASLADEMENMNQDQLVAAYEQTREITELDYLISRIDAIRAELWRRSQQHAG